MLWHLLGQLDLTAAPSSFRALSHCCHAHCVRLIHHSPGPEQSSIKMSRPASSGLPAAPSHHPCVARLPNTARLPAARAVGRTSGCTATSSCTSSSSSSSSSSSGHSRRELLLRTTPAALLPLLAAGLGTDDPTTILNSVLSAYGLPTLAATKGFKAYDDFEQGFLLEYPRSWVSRPNTLRKGFYVSDYQAGAAAQQERA